MAVTDGVRARTVVGKWKGELAENYDFCWMRRTEAERREQWPSVKTSTARRALCARVDLCAPAAVFVRFG